MKYSVAVDWSNIAFDVIVDWRLFRNNGRVAGDKRTVVFPIGPLIVGLERA
jgi:hypothetical protein